MKKKLGIIFLLALTLQSFANKIDSNAIKTAKHAIQFSLGLHQFQEKNLHNKPYRGISYQIAYSISWNKKNYSTFQFSILNSHNKPTIERELSSMNASIQLGYAYLWEIVNKNNWEYFLGPAAQLHYNASYLPNWDESHLYWSNSLQLKLNQRLKYNFKNNHNLSLNIDLPIIGGLSRPDTQRDYKLDDLTGKGVLKAFHSNINFTQLIKNFQISVNAEYEFPRKSKAIPSLFYHFSLLNFKANNSQNFKSINNSIGVKWQL